MDEDYPALPRWSPEELERIRHELSETRRALRQAPLAVRLRHALDATAAKAVTGFRITITRT
jgi:hypothetical protein